MAEAVTAAGSWRAELGLRFEGADQRTVLRRRGGRGPLYVQRPFYPEGPVCHCYLLHPPGGVAGGDDLLFDLEFGPGSDALLTTPAATKLYRCAGTASRLTQRLVVEADARAEWLPQETLLFSGASAQLALTVDLAPTARLLALDLVGLGRPFSGDPFVDGSLTQRVTITRAQQPLLSEKLVLEGGSALLSAPWGLAGAEAYGALYAYPADLELVRWLRSRTQPQASCALGLVDQLSVTCIDGLLVVRARRQRLDHLKAQLESCWSLLREPVLGRRALRPRIWNT